MRYGYRLLWYRGQGQYWIWMTASNFRNNEKKFKQALYPCALDIQAVSVTLVLDITWAA